MANLIRSAKSGSEWSENDSEVYNIDIQLKDTPTFYVVNNLPPSVQDQEVLTTQNAEDMVSDRNAELILDLAMKPATANGSAVDDFAVEFFRLLGYVRHHRVALTRKDTHSSLDLWRMETRKDRSLSHPSSTERNYSPRAGGQTLRKGQQSPKSADRRIRLQQPNPKGIGPGDFGNQDMRSHHCNRKLLIRHADHPGHHPRRYRTYLLPVTADLVHHVRHGTYPPETTIVSAHVPVIPRPLRRHSEGMKHLDSRQAILSYYEAFKSVIGI
ncbi:hypothetical protein C8Q74DRAFT_1277265 [Fomes fomentarius]|nr:hypothetical protein C8Q74DRAFT_1277265 [Fomes fomentarius]